MASTEKAKINRLFKQVIESFTYLFFPNFCISCGKPLNQEESYICTPCYMDLPLTHIRKTTDNFVAQKFWGRIPVEAAFSYLLFSKHTGVQNILHAIKYDTASDLAVKFGQMIGHYIKQETDFPEFDALVPVPLHPKKQKIRGYNQAEKIAQGIGQILRKEVLNDAVIRKVFTESQTTKSRQERWLNVQKIFSVADKRALSSKHIVLVDDVLTTGATLESLASTIEKASPSKISVITLAVAR